MPYRESVALARYPVRSSRAYLAAVAAAAALTAAGPIWILGSTSMAFAASPSILLLAALPGLVALAAYASSADAHWVAGGRSEVVLHATRVVVPPAWGTKPLSFHVSGIELGFTEFRGSINFIPVSHVEVLTISGGGMRRKLSSRLFEDRGALRRLALDIERLRAGELPTGPEPELGAPAPRDHLDDIIDRELDEL